MNVRGVHHEMSLYLPLVKRRLSRYLFFTIPLPSAARRPLPALYLRSTCTLRDVAQPFTLPTLYLLYLPFTPPWRALDCIYTAYLCTGLHNYSRRRRPLLNLDHSFANPLPAAARLDTRTAGRVPAAPDNARH